MRVVEFKDGLAIQGTFPDQEILDLIKLTAGPCKLWVLDPPFGNIVNTTWDQTKLDDKQFCQWMIDWTKCIEQLSIPGSALYVFGGVGLPRDNDKGKPPFRPFLRYLVEAELQTGYQLSTPIVWGKRRAYGINWGYLFTREELAYFVLGNHKKPLKFTIPLLEKERGYEGYLKKYPAKSKFLRRSNVWTDINELFRGKLHINQKPQRLLEIPIEIHTDPGDFVIDCFAGSGSTAMAARKLGRKFIVVEQDPMEFDKMVARLNK